MTELQVYWGYYEMSKINRFRIVNLSYNNDSIKIDDEIFSLDGESSLLSLRNGGGKTVLVQMITALFVNQKYRNLGDRLFSSYFTTGKPTFIMVEWALDMNQGYLLTGMMLRKNMNTAEDDTELLEIINFTAEYKEACTNDIANLPIISHDNSNKRLRGFGDCKQIFDELKIKKENKFNYYDMTVQNQKKQYFSKLKEYQIDHKEWESIIRKVNLKESGLSELFANAKDERGLIEKWFIEAIENKLNQEKSRINGFEKIVLQLIKQYKNNESKIKKREIILKFEEDSKQIYEQIDRYIESENNEIVQNNKIANFIIEVDNTINVLENEKRSVEDSISRISELIRKTNYDMLSFEYYELEGEKSELVLAQCDKEALITSLEKEKKDLTRKKGKLKCIKQNSRCRDIEKKVKKYEEQKNAILLENIDKKKELSNLGRILIEYYSAELERVTSNIEECDSQIISYQKILQENRGNIDVNKEKINKCNKEIGKSEERIASYDKYEMEFTKRYTIQLNRTIIGEYEAGTIEILKRDIGNELSDKKKTLLESKNKFEKLGITANSVKSNKDECIRKIATYEAKKKSITDKLSIIKSEEEQRKTIIKYINGDETDLYNRDLLISKYDSKIKDLDRLLHEQIKLREDLKDEYTRLKDGKLIELPDSIKEYFSDSEIDVIYGMEWLKKNGNTLEYNQKLIEINPFLPYSIILKKEDIIKLEQDKTEIYTTFPIPIIEKECLETASISNKSAIIKLDNIRFFVMFNNHLLDSKKLELLLLEKNHLIEEVENKIQIRTEEIEYYRKYKDILYNQILTKEYKEECEEEYTECNEELVKLDKENEMIINSIKKLEEEIDFCNKDIIELSSRITILTQEEQDCINLEAEYNEYLAARNTLDTINIELNTIWKDIFKLEQENNTIESDIRQENDKLSKLSNEKDGYRDKCNKYKEYVDMAKNELLEAAKLASEETYEDNKADLKKDIRMYDAEIDYVRIEARYDSISEKISRRLPEIEQELQIETNEYEQSKEELLYLEQEYKLCFEEYKNCIYSREEEEKINSKIEKIEKDKNTVNIQFNELDKQIGIIVLKIENKLESIFNETGEGSPTDRNTLIISDFKATINVNRSEQEKQQSLLSKINKHINYVQIIQQSSLEYKYLELKEVITFDKEIISMSEKEIKEYWGILTRDRRKYIEFKNAVKDKTTAIIRDISTKQEYQDEYFKKGFNSLLSVVDSSESLKKQMDTTVYSYDSIMYKLDIDLKNIAEEQKKVEEILLEYVKDIDTNMNQIDKNSTISIRDKSLKMLKIKVPDWDENSNIYELRIHDFIEEITKQGVCTIDSGNNIEEYLGKRINTKNLYDSIVGISNIGVGLYKIEAEREVQISWANVASNSGGEGFLSAFVVLSCLLSYMRRDESNMFVSKEEGKVLIMDNPFAQTNAEHLLKPLMEIAKKTNTQLICLSGLSGDTIYNRFDNIYVISIVNSNIKRNMSYMRSEHIKGEKEQKSMVLSQFKTEQASLFDLIEEY